MIEANLLNTTSVSVQPENLSWEERWEKRGALWGRSVLVVEEKHWRQHLQENQQQKVSFKGLNTNHQLLVSNVEALLKATDKQSFSLNSEFSLIYRVVVLSIPSGFGLSFLKNFKVITFDGKALSPSEDAVTEAVPYWLVTIVYRQSGFMVAEDQTESVGVGGMRKLKLLEAVVLAFFYRRLVDDSLMQEIQEISQQLKKAGQKEITDWFQVRITAHIMASKSSKRLVEYRKTKADKERNNDGLSNAKEELKKDLESYQDLITLRNGLCNKLFTKLSSELDFAVVAKAALQKTTFYQGSSKRPISFLETEIQELYKLYSLVTSLASLDGDYLEGDGLPFQDANCPQVMRCFDEGEGGGHSHIRFSMRHINDEDQGFGFLFFKNKLFCPHENRYFQKTQPEEVSLSHIAVECGVESLPIETESVVGVINRKFNDNDVLERVHHFSHLATPDASNHTFFDSLCDLCSAVFMGPREAQPPSNAAWL